jgi:hypothetical protein
MQGASDSCAQDNLTTRSKGFMLCLQSVSAMSPLSRFNEACVERSDDGAQ